LIGKLIFRESIGLKEEIKKQNSFRKIVSEFSHKYPILFWDYTKSFLDYSQVISKLFKLLKITACC
jgi:hypothetical protein